MTNLVDNAVRHARTRGRAAARSADGGVLVTVTDDGPGIPAADRERVFDRFTRLDDGRGPRRRRRRAGPGDRAGAGAAGTAARSALADAAAGVRAEVRLPRFVDSVM